MRFGIPHQFVLVRPTQFQVSQNSPGNTGGLESCHVCTVEVSCNTVTGQAYYDLDPVVQKVINASVLRLTRSIYGLWGASKAFMKQLGSEVEGFSEKVEYKDADGQTKV